MSAQRFFVGVHFQRHFGGPGHLNVSPGALVLTNRRGSREVRQRGGSVVVERKRWEPPTGNHWVEVTDGEETGWATVPRRRAERIAAALEAAGFEVLRRP
jgi:hypothetical protein